MDLWIFSHLLVSHLQISHLALGAFSNRGSFKVLLHLDLEFLNCSSKHGFPIPLEPQTQPETPLSPADGSAGLGFCGWRGLVKSNSNSVLQLIDLYFNKSNSYSADKLQLQIVLIQDWKLAGWLAGSLAGGQQPLHWLAG